MMLMTILIKIRLKSKHHSFSNFFSKISGPWTDRGHPVERTYWHVERTYWHVERTYRHVDTVTNKNGATFRIYSAQSPDQTFSTAPKN